MGLDMYLWRETPEQHKVRENLDKETGEFYCRWNKTFMDFPVLGNGRCYRGLDKAKFTDEQKSLYEKYCREQEELFRRRDDAIQEEDELRWRKFNALHGYIVDNFADGVDECQEIEIGIDGAKDILEALEKTLDIINKNGCDSVMKSAPMKPRSGFFFGSCDVDEYFVSNVKDSIKRLRKFIDTAGDKTIIIYKASW